MLQLLSFKRTNNSIDSLSSLKSESFCNMKKQQSSTHYINKTNSFNFSSKARSLHYSLGHLRGGLS